MRIGSDFGDRNPSPLSNEGPRGLSKFQKDAGIDRVGLGPKPPQIEAIEKKLNDYYKIIDAAWPKADSNFRKIVDDLEGFLRELSNVPIASGSPWKDVVDRAKKQLQAACDAFKADDPNNLHDKKSIFLNYLNALNQLHLQETKETKNYPVPSNITDAIKKLIEEADGKTKKPGDDGFDVMFHLIDIQMKFAQFKHNLPRGLDTDKLARIQDAMDKLQETWDKKEPGYKDKILNELKNILDSINGLGK